MCLGLLVAAVICLFIGEIGVFHICSLWWEWPNFQAASSTTGLHHPGDVTVPATRLKLLLLSDPHIQCTFNRYEPLLFRWDADRFLRSGFSLLMKTMRPDMVVVLGDIFAEGYKASAQEWTDYLQVCLYSKALLVPPPPPPHQFHSHRFFVPCLYLSLLTTPQPPFRLTCISHNVHVPIYDTHYCANHLWLSPLACPPATFRYDVALIILCQITCGLTNVLQITCAFLSCCSA